MMTEIMATQKINILDIFKEAWDNVKGFDVGYGNKTKIWFGVFVVSFSDMLFKRIFLHLPVISNLLALFVFAPLVVGLLMMGVRCVMKAPFSLGNLFSFYRDILRLFLISLLLVASVLLLMGLGFLLVALLVKLWRVLSLVAVIGIFFGIVFMNLVYAYALLVFVDHRLGVWASVKTAVRGFLAHRWRLIFLFILSGLVELLVILPSVVAVGVHAPGFVKVITALFALCFIWVVPWSVNVFALTYRNIFGVRSLGDVTA